MSLLETINELGPEQTELLYHNNENSELLTVRQYQSYRWLSVDGEMIQSLMDVEHPASLLLPNLQAMLAVLEFIEQPRTVLNLGAGAGTLQRYFSEQWPKLTVTSVECSSAVVDLAVRYFQMQASDYAIDTAEHYLSVNEHPFDIVLVDIFSAEQQPSCLYEPGFYKDLARSISGSGVAAFNLLPESEADLLKILRPLNEHVATLLLYEVPNHDNVIIYALKRCQLGMTELGNKIAAVNRALGLDIKLIASQA